MMRVAVLGNCQTSGIAKCIEVIAPQTEIAAYRLDMGNAEEIAQIARDLPKFDLVFSQVRIGDQFGAVSMEAIGAQIGPKLIRFPWLSFRGLHPDFAYLTHGGRFLTSPTWSYHSLIACAAFVARIPWQRAVHLYNTYVFASLGYYAAFDDSRRILEKNVSGLGYDFCLDGAEWNDVFMYTFDHPTVQAIYAIALIIARKIGIASDHAPSSAPETLPDRLASGACLPVYPDLAKRLGFVGSNTFMRDIRQSEKLGRPRPLDLEQFVQESYDIYKKTKPEFFQHASVQNTSKLLKRL